MTARATVSPPNPESNIPIGRSTPGRLRPFGAGQRMAARADSASHGPPPYRPPMDHTELSALASTIDEIGSAFYFRPATLAVGKEHGLDGYRFYFVGRGGVLGDVEADVALSAFGYFEPNLFASMWNSAKAIMAPREAARLYHGCNHDLGRARLSDV